ncbi:nucleoside hydrolase [Desarmillaria tabescens]|uniref:Nucleoside hydrolase n=1 Tax=Armillaria tabescens TaxID=1929756 RepID=A0AA39KDU5_ARMTA|nr:nucleoside hydrolase [Desarmillaria tabescens]KAK0459162.1 nucleoside hydrolase [Desarmillaria tabescens]
MATSRNRIPAIIDTDPGVDDIIAILFALASPELEVLSIVVSFGNTDIQSSYANILKTYQALTRHFDAYPAEKARFSNYSASPKTSLVFGSDAPLEGDIHSAQYFHGRDGLGGITERHSELNAEFDATADHPQLLLSKKPAVENSLELLRCYPERSITYIALGPLTNLAQLMRRDRDLVRGRIGRIVCMGGALDVPGNTSPVAEFNFFADPYAVKELLMPSKPELGLPLDRFFLLPLDITTPHELPFPVYQARVDPSFSNMNTPSVAGEKKALTHFTSSFLEHTRTVMLQFGKDAMELHDIVAVWCAIANPPSSTALSPGWSMHKRTFEIERIGELTRGMLIIDRREDEAAYAPGANRAFVQEELDKHQLAHGPWESTAVPAAVEVESLEYSPHDGGSRISCITRTPGHDVLLQLLLERVWGA